MRNWMLIALLLSGVCAPGCLQAASVDHQHDFDFEFGSWTATLRIQPHPLTKANVWLTFTGTSVVRKVWNGRANLGELEVTSGSKHIEAMTLRIYDTRSKTWSIYFANADSGLDST